MGKTGLSDDTHICAVCDEEFRVESVFDDSDDVLFCPYCGSDLEVEEIDEDELDDDENYRY